MGSLKAAYIGIGVTILGFAVTLAVAYVWLLPELFPGYKTYSLFACGVTAAALIGGYHCYQVVDVTFSTISKMLIAALGGIVVAVLVIFLSLLIILNVRGS